MLQLQLAAILYVFAVETNASHVAVTHLCTVLILYPAEIHAHAMLHCMVPCCSCYYQLFATKAALDTAVLTFGELQLHLHDIVTYCTAIMYCY